MSWAHAPVPGAKVLLVLARQQRERLVQRTKYVVTVDLSQKLASSETEEH